MCEEQSPRLGALLRALGYNEEPEAAVSVGVAEKTFIEYRKLGIGPDYAVVGRMILYSDGAIAKWLAAGGTRARENTS